MKYIIRFTRKNFARIKLAYQKLRTRWKKVKYILKLIHDEDQIYYDGYFKVFS